MFNGLLNPATAFAFAAVAAFAFAAVVVVAVVVVVAAVAVAVVVAQLKKKIASRHFLDSAYPRFAFFENIVRSRVQILQGFPDKSNLTTAQASH